MKKSFKKAIAILLAVMMIVCSFPLTVLAAGESRTNIDLRFGDVSNTATPKTYTYKNATSLTNFDKFTGLNSTALDYDKNTGKINGYGIGDYFTVTVLMRNVTELAAAEVAINYSKSITPAYIQNIKRPNSTLPAEYTSTQAQLDEFPKLEAVPAQSGNAIHNNGTFTVGETSYIDAENSVMYANFAVQTGAPTVDTKSVTVGKETFKNTAVLATFMFKIVSDDPITFNIATDAADKYKTYYLNTAADGGKVSEYELYDQVDAESPALDFLGENEYNEPSVKTYTITFVDENGEKIKDYTYEENAQIIETPAFPASTKIDGTNHTAYKWDKDVPATATANVTIKRVKFNEAHTWGEWKETKAPTTTETGLKERECSVCHAKETADIPKLPEAHVHKWSEWTYNNDAVYNKNSKLAVDGTATRKCTDPDCPEHATQTKTIAGTGQLRANTATVTLGAAVVLNTGIDVSRQQKFASSYIEILFDGKPYNLTEISKDNTTATRNFYDFDMISPDKFGDEITITAYGVTEDGIVCKGHSIKYSIKQYCYNTYGRDTTGDSLKTLLVELLYYGKDYQLYRNYKTDQLVTSSMTEEQHSRHTTDVPTYTKVTNPNFESNPNGSDANEIYFKAATMELQGKVIPQVKIELSKTRDIRDYTFTWIINGKSESFTYDEHPDWLTPTNASKNTEDVNNAYLVNCHVLKANQFSIPFDIIVTKNGKQVSNKLRYSVESYTFSGAYKADTKLKNLVDQLLRYGRADVQYVGNTN